MSIEQSNEDKEVSDFNAKYNQSLALQGGYPTIFKLSGGKLSYYSGNRSHEALLKWIMKG